MFDLSFDISSSFDDGGGDKNKKKIMILKSIFKSLKYKNKKLLF